MAEPSTTGGRRDAADEAQRDHLLSSIEDLDAELAAGDITAEDHRRLRDSYVSKAGDVIERIEHHHHYGVPRAGRRSLDLTKLAVVVGVLVVAVVAGIALKNALGSRSDGGSLTGTDSFAGRLAGCQQRDPADSLGCFDELLREAPGNPDALTYRAWAQYRLGEKAAAVAVFQEVVTNHADYPDVRVFRAVAAKDDADWPAARAELDALWALNPPQQIRDTVSQMQLAATIDLNVLPEPVQACWSQANTVGDALTSSPTSQPAGTVAEGFTLVVACFDAALMNDFGNADALTTKAAAIIGLVQESYYPQAIESLDLALTSRPDDPTALLLRAAARHAQGDEQGARADLDLIQGRRTSGLFPIDTSRLSDAVDAGLR